jgi:hypothetical protein
MNRGRYKLPRHDLSSSVIIDNLHIARVPPRPYKAQPVFQAHPDRVLTQAIRGKRFQRIPSASQIAERRGGGGTMKCGYTETDIQH